MSESNAGYDAQKAEAYAAEADAAYAALLSLVPGFEREAREELLVANVSPERVDALYPLDFDQLVLNLIDHYQHTGTDHLAFTGKQTDDRRADAQIYRAKWPEPVQQRWLAQHPSARPYSEDVWELLYFLRDQVGGHDWYAFPAVLWDAWWTMANRSLLPPKSQPAANYSILWVKRHLLPHLHQI